MKISELYTAARHDAGSEMQIHDEHGKPTALYICFVGVDSKLYRSKQRELERASLAFIRDPENAAKISDEEFYASCAIDWRGDFLDEKGKPLKFSVDIVRGIFEQAPYILNQVKNHIRNRENFTKG